MSDADDDGNEDDGDDEDGGDHYRYIATVLTFGVRGLVNLQCSVTTICMNASVNGALSSSHISILESWPEAPKALKLKEHFQIMSFVRDP